jgi:preprotein translocase subunit SecF
VQLFVNANYDFLGVRRYAYFFSGALLLIGLFSVFFHRGLNYSIDFEGGLMMRIAFEQPVQVGELRQIVAGVSTKSPEITRDIDEEGNYIIRIERLEEAEGEAAAQQIKNLLGSAFPGNPVTIRSVEDVGPKVGSELRTKAFWAVLWAMIGILIYVSWRFEFRFAVASIIPLFHDVLITLGVFSLMNIEISLQTVAAVLTIVGYSLNDTIVVLDRIREDLKRYRQESYDWIFNRAINETLSRTIMTSITTLIVVSVLWLAGGSVIHDFAFALLVGIVIGTYSSIFVAAPILVEWQHWRPRVRAKKTRL